eukprot:COSAG01_NODE_46864_length_396_cov_0.683502_1_plen_99_part_00
MAPRETKVGCQDTREELCVYAKHICARTSSWAQVGQSCWVPQPQDGRSALWGKAATMLQRTAFVGSFAVRPSTCATSESRRLSSTDHVLRSRKRARMG